MKNFDEGINKRSEFGLRTGTYVLKPVFITGHFVLRPVQWYILAIFWYFLGPSSNGAQYFGGPSRPTVSTQSKSTNVVSNYANQTPIKGVPYLKHGDSKYFTRQNSCEILRRHITSRSSLAIIYNKDGILWPLKTFYTRYKHFICNNIKR